MEKRGLQPHKRFTMDSDYNEVKSEFERLSTTLVDAYEEGLSNATDVLSFEETEFEFKVTPAEAIQTGYAELFIKT